MPSRKRFSRPCGLDVSHANVGVAHKTDLEKYHKTASAGPRGVLVPRQPDAKPFEVAFEGLIDAAAQQARTRPAQVALTTVSVATVSIGQALAGQPLRNPSGDLGIVPILHHHVTVTSNSHIRQVDPVHGAASSPDGVGIFGVGLLEGRPARMLVDEIAEHRQYGTSFSFGALTIISAVADSTATMALILSGRCSATFNPKALPKNSATRRYVSADLRASNKKGRPFGRPSHSKLRAELLTGVYDLDPAILCRQRICNFQPLLAETCDQQRVGRDLIGLDQIAAHRFARRCERPRLYSGLPAASVCPFSTNTLPFRPGLTSASPSALTAPTAFGPIRSEL